METLQTSLNQTKEEQSMLEITHKKLVNEYNSTNLMQKSFRSKCEKVKINNLQHIQEIEKLTNQLR